LKFRKALGVAIRNARRKAKVTSTDIEVTGIISRRGLSAWETGESPPNVERLKTFADHLKIRLSDLIAEAEFNSK